MGQECSQRIRGPEVLDYTEETVRRILSKHEKRRQEMAALKVPQVDDQSEMAMFTAYEEQLNIRNVHLEDFESRLKQFVYKPPTKEPEPGVAPPPLEDATVKLKQLRAAFRGNQFLEAMLEDKQSLDWRLLMVDDIFVVIQDEHDNYREAESFEEDPELTFRVAELNLLGLLYCKCEQKERVERFYMFLQPGLEDTISCQDRDLEAFVPLMGRICYEALIICFNAEFEGTERPRPELIPSFDKIEQLDRAQKALLHEDDVGFLDKLFNV